MKYFVIILTIIGFIVACQYQAVSQNTPEPLSTIPKVKEKPIIVAVIDTGFDFDSDWKETLSINPTLKKPNICKYGHKDFTGFGLKDGHGHGTHVSGLIGQYSETNQYCLVFLKYFNSTEDNTDSLSLSLKSLQRAIDLKVDIINYSGGGSIKSQEECDLIKKALNLGIVIVAAAGNEKTDINHNPYYPAMCDKRVVVVSNVDTYGDYSSSSNFTNHVEIESVILEKENGIAVMSILPNNSSGYMTGTSQSAAIKTGKIIKNWKKR